MCCMNGPLNVAKQVFILMEPELNYKTELNDSNLGDFKASNEWLELFKKRLV